ncbi:MAG: RluA family pseudouridine synthase, partial [Treponema sp.]|nr:RluA family pseudouridine synthase [Clostridia bacterium]MCF0243007.1 RluA family pseudouridine synthase [Treponema sp.]
MDFRSFKCGKNDEGRRLDKVLRIFLPDISLSLIYKYIRNGLIRVNNKKQKENYRVECEDIIQIADFLFNNDSEATNKNNAPVLFIENQIIFKNEHILILNKPYDVKVHGDKYSLDSAVKNFYEKNIKNDSLSFKPGPLHRLDRKTTGLVAFSLSYKGAEWFSENIKNHNIKKTYSGIIEGKLLKPET